MAAWIAGPIAERLPDAVRCVDPFHLVELATDALDLIRREVWNTPRNAGEVAAAKDLKDARFALWKNPESLTGRQPTELADIKTVNGPLYRAYLLTEQLWAFYRVAPEHAEARLDAWLSWARGRAWTPSSSSPGRSQTSAPRSSPPPDTDSPTPASKRSHADPDAHPPRLRLPQVRTSACA